MNEYDTGAKSDMAGKLRFDLIPPEVDLAYAEVLTDGIGKGYAERNWEKGLPFTAHLSKLKRHLNAWELGQDINTADGNLNHMQHVLWHVAAIVTMIKRNRTDLDDRPSIRSSDK